MQFLIDEFAGTKASKSVVKSLKEGCSPVAGFGLSHIHKVLLSAMLSQHKRVLYICADEAEGQRVLEDLRALGISAELFAQRDISFFAKETSRDYEQKRIGTLSKLLEGDFSVAVTTLQAAAVYTIPPSVLRRRLLHLERGARVDITELIKAAATAGYSRVETVDAAGQFAVRGGIFDVFPPDAAAPYRIELWGDEIDTINSFDIDTQRRISGCNGFDLSPSVELCPDSESDFLEKLKAKAQKALPEP